MTQWKIAKTNKLRNITAMLILSLTKFHNIPKDSTSPKMFSGRRILFHLGQIIYLYFLTFVIHETGKKHLHILRADCFPATWKSKFICFQSGYLFVFYSTV